MNSQAKKNTRSIKGLIKIISIIILVVSCLVYIGISLGDYHDKIINEHNTKIEQTHENIKIAEEMIENELHVSGKYFKMIGTRIFLFASEETELNINTDAYWVSKDITCKVQVNGENYSVIFETHKVDSKNEEIEMYEPVKINKIIKEQK
ncbi:hypothetical protein P9027_30340 [Bacillus thuringiensis]|uniref:hypothetical protein n=1 Tax=Bacillus thuringiensis TaxID=1428 RepID=UPI002DBEE0BD|nr:hypothetical protein [Bacillus thuringiensis]MEC3226218.1 hypothetical protein [Bacillus thuringiensis]MEC3463568.1 hypothetical protein [Bacillus thuringiensis]MEC3556639.1 hypothetical protein [Bacillus thuringiensis]MED2061341.1 hypothetical protein [Bacillus thuringiensis]